MNERIRELSKEAWAWAEQQEYTDPTKEFSDMLEQKFAELIVRECIEIVSIWSDEEPCSEGYDIMPVYRIKQHFGVE